MLAEKFSDNCNNGFVSYYLGPTRHSVHLSNLEEISCAAEGGLLGENQWCELKGELGPTNKPVNLELARDLASLSLDGGVLIFGVADKTFELIGCDATSLETRISQVAATAVQPPLSPVFNPPITLPNGKSIVVVSIPPSSVAPHMADNRYWGRSSEGKRILSDAEVRRLIEAQSARRNLFSNSFKEFIEQDPLSRLVENGASKNGHGFFMATPQGHLKLDNFSQENLQDLLASLSSRHNSNNLNYMLKNCCRPARDPKGVGLRSVFEQVPQKGEWKLTQVTVSDEGTVMSTFAESSSLYPLPDGKKILCTYPNRTVQFLAQNLEILSLLSKDYGYQGEWQGAIGLTRLDGATRRTSDFSYRPFPYSQNTYIYEATLQPMDWADDSEKLNDMTLRLLRGYLRGLGIENYSYIELMKGI